MNTLFHKRNLRKAPQATTGSNHLTFLPDSSAVERRALDPDVGGSNPSLATKRREAPTLQAKGPSICLIKMKQINSEN